MKSFFRSFFLTLSGLILMIGLHMACNLQQRTSQRHSVQMKQQQEIIRSDSFNLNWRAGHFYLASESSRVQAVVIPEGVFQYSPAQGYTGRASKVMIQQSHHQQELNKDSNRLQWIISDKVTMNTKQQVKERHREQIKIPINEWKVVLILSLILILFLFYCFKRKRF